MAFLLTLTTTIFAQAPAAPSPGTWAIIDTQYNVGTTTAGISTAKLTLQNTTATLITGTQFRVFYDKNAFSAASVALNIPSANLNLQFIDNNTAGYITITLVYTGSSAAYTLPNGEAFEITFTHVPAATFMALASISNLTWTASPVGAAFTAIAATNPGADLSLSLHNYGGQWIQPVLTFSGNFTNVTGSPAKNLTLALQKKPQTGSTWTQHASYTTDIAGNFTFTETIDTTYYDVRLAIQGDTLSVGNVITSADAALINQWVLGGATPQGFDYYTADVNGTNNITITDAYGVFGRIAGRFSVWPNSVKDVKFFTAGEYATIIGTPGTNYTSTIPGTTNFYYNILPGGPASVTYYVCVPGDANGTGYHMARLTPITVLPTPLPGYPSAMENIIDEKVEYDFPTSSMEINMPSIVVKEGNLVEIPVTINTNGEELTALQLGMLYDGDLLEFKELVNSDKAMFWMSALNPTGGIVEWVGYDPSANGSYKIGDNYTIFTLNFIAKQPQAQWVTSPLWTTRKFVGDQNKKDMTINPTNGILVVCKMAFGGTIDETSMIVYPNPTSGDVNISFEVKEKGKVTLFVADIDGSVKQIILDKEMPAGHYTYSTNLENMATGVYVAALKAKNQKDAQRIIKQ